VQRPLQSHSRRSTLSVLPRIIGPCSWMALGSVTMRLSLHQSRISCLTFCVRSALQLCWSEVRDRIRAAACDVTSRNFSVTRIEGFLRRKPVVVRTTPAGVVLPTGLGAGSRP
jgi:hypothetical protein